MTQLTILLVIGVIIFLLRNGTSVRIDSFSSDSIALITSFPFADKQIIVGDNIQFILISTLRGKDVSLHIKTKDGLIELKNRLPALEPLKRFVTENDIAFAIRDEYHTDSLDIINQSIKRPEIIFKLE
ncbi:hypothetical protein [Pedobacter puniceum]|uniref:Uncharacterized protein n=1 Tax=Pedobacter puniceum TaxID=2666136 RepID=A0A7K0FMH6_9SPHI|nr:hypothetical protein [Pedobacter puniceum]MRX46635.1 hypothetical protein [Pedobacter puniceum]